MRASRGLWCWACEVREVEVRDGGGQSWARSRVARDVAGRSRLRELLPHCERRRIDQVEICAAELTDALCWLQYWRRRDDLRFEETVVMHQRFTSLLIFHA